MTKEEARIRLEKLNESISSHKNCIDKKEREIIELEAIINKKDDWRNREINREEYVLLANKITLMQEMHQFAHVKNEGWLPDWESGYMDRYGVVRGEYGGFKVRCRISYNDFIFGLAVKSLEIAEEMFEEFGERISEVYNKQY